MQVQEGKSKQKWQFVLKPLTDFFLFILMSTYYNKSNCNVKESSEQTLIEMSISNGVNTVTSRYTVLITAAFFRNQKSLSRGLTVKVLVDYCGQIFRPLLLPASFSTNTFTVRRIQDTMKKVGLLKQ